MDALKGFMESELFYLFVLGVVLIIISLVIRRGRMEGEHSSVAEKIMFGGGILLVLTSVLILGFRSDVIETEDTTEESQEIKKFGEGSGCSKPKKTIKTFDNQ